MAWKKKKKKEKQTSNRIYARVHAFITHNTLQTAQSPQFTVSAIYFTTIYIR